MARHEDDIYEDNNDAHNAGAWENIYGPSPGYLYVRVRRTIEETHEAYDDTTHEYYQYLITKIEHWSYYYTTGYRYVPSDGFEQLISKFDGFSDGISARRCVSYAWAPPHNYTHQKSIEGDAYTGSRDEIIISNSQPYFTLYYNGDISASGPTNTIEINPQLGILTRETTYDVEESSSGGPVFENKGRGWHVDQNLELVHNDLPDAYVMNDNPTSWKLDENGTLVTLLLPDVYVDRQGAFSGCNTLTGITIPATCTSIGMWSFYGTSLTEVELPENCTYYVTSFPEGCTITGGVLIDEFGNPIT